MKRIAIFLFEGAELFEIASFTDIFGWNNVVGLKEFRDIKLETISYKESIKCTWGGKIKVEKVIIEENIGNFFDYSIYFYYITIILSLTKLNKNSINTYKRLFKR